MKTAKKNQYCEIHNSIRATLNLSCKMKSKHNKAIRYLNLQNPQCVTKQDHFTFGDLHGQFFFKLLYSTIYCHADNTQSCAL